MTYVALTALAALLVATLAFANVIRWLIREHARERNLMLNQLLHLAGRTWESPPEAHVEPGPELEDLTTEFLDPAQLTYP